MTSQRIADQVAELLKRPYTRITTRDPEGTFSAYVLELPGVFSGGATEAEAASNLTEAMELWLEAALEEGYEIPEPLPAREYSGNIRLRLPQSLHQTAAIRAQIDGVSMNQLFVVAISTYLGERRASARIYLETALNRAGITSFTNAPEVWRYEDFPFAKRGAFSRGFSTAWTDEAAESPPAPARRRR